MRKSTSKSLGSAPPTYDQKKFDNYSKANKRGAYSNSKVRQSVDFDDDLDEEWYNPTTWFNDDDEDKLNSLIAQDKKDKKPSYRKGISSKTQNAICSNPDLKAMNPKACESKGNTMKTKQITKLKENIQVSKDKDGPFTIAFNGEVVGEYDTIDELKTAHEHLLNKIARPENTGLPRYSVDTVNGEYVLKADDEVIGTYSSEPELRAAATEHMNSFNEGTELNELKGFSGTEETEWEIVINGNTYTTSNGATEDEAINNFWKAVVEKEGIKKFLGDMVFAQESTSSTDLDEDLTAMLRIAGLR